MGHFVEKCYQLHGYPPGHPKARTDSIFNSNKNTSMANQVYDGANKDDGKLVVTGISEAQLQQLLSLLNDKDERTSSQANTTVAKPGLSKISSPHWIIDSSAIDHISPSLKLFLHEDKNISLPPVLLPSGEKANIVAKGSLLINTVYYLRDVVCVPTFKVNLMLVSRLTRDLNCSMTFFPHWCVLQDVATRRVIGLGKQRDRLHYLAVLTTGKIGTTSHSSPNRQPTCNLTTSSTDLWHSRLGHISHSRLSFIPKNFLKFSIQSDNTCPISPLAKKHRLPFGTSEISSKKPFDLIHCNIWGRYKYSSLAGAHYFLTIVDDYTCFTWIFLMKHKDEAQPLIKRFFSYVSHQFESHIKIFRSDNSGDNFSK